MKRPRQSRSAPTPASPEPEASGGGRLAAALVAACGVIILCLPLVLNPALPRGSDVYSTTHYLQGFMKAFGEGDLYPRWTDRSNQGLGGPSFVMFVPITYYGAGMASWLTGSTISGFKLYIVIISALTAGAFYLLVREYVAARLPAALATAVYVLLPYHVLDIYQRFAMSETTAFLFTALLLYFIRRHARRPGAAALLGAALSYAALVGTHLLSAFMTTLLLAFLMLWEFGLDWRRLISPVLALGCGLGLAAPALIPAVVEKQHVNIAWVREMPNGDYRINFIFKDEVLPGLGFKDPVKPPVFRSAHAQLGLAGVGAAMTMLGAAGASRRRRDAAGLAIASGIAYLMQTAVSLPVWTIVPELATIQFPWRFQTLQVLFAALLCGMAMEQLRDLRRRRPEGWMLRPAILAIVVALNLGLALQNAHLKPYDFDQATARDPGVTAWIEPAFTPVEFRGYRRFRETRVTMPEADFLSGEGKVTVEEWRSSGRRISVSSEEGGTVGLRSFWFPGWTARVDGEEVPIEPATDYAIQSVKVPPGSHTIEFSFDATPVRRFAGWTGIVFLFLTPAVCWILRAGPPQPTVPT